MAYISFQPTDFFSPKLYTGTGATHNVTGVGFQPDFVWMKRRDGSASHRLCDSVRGATKLLQSNATDAEQTDANTLTAFDSDGFTLGADSAPYNVNVSGQTMVSWNWKMGTTSGLSGGTITPSSYSFDTTARQSVIAYTGTGSTATVPHGLGATPGLIIVKRLDTTDNWWTHVKSMTGGQYIALNGTSAAGTATSVWNDTLPTSTVFTVGTDVGVNASGGTFIAYCFAPKKGYSSFGKYVGNGSADGPFVNIGFRPAYLILRRTDSGGDWFCWDNKRGPYNVNTPMLAPNAVTAETSTAIPDFLSNGFKLRSTNVDANASGGTYIYMAFAEFPLVSSNSKAGTAR